ncbi:xanthine dehydrogenase family protein subunit M [Brevibacillus agri]|uniref:FAD binding domain-containing protein n=1 Tax=Brevibacillus agri TaxID=51101 RepID=UPI002E1AA7D7|nr:xanthine dehydrogenase family protein subunit M [Brevibacillus agri]MED1657210.1 xanthine dehydrogenase family protein subunit M [Brevibacillus agri]MED1689625.1 xanthine dehydrogenase family protein subunit M [Brevibacillus agri]MED1693911.1 xanthine dehydrogenase family protein subunit M [Brevibacillus agri]MED1698287.1 xanthine dehydrogenase family protein subunit M [Brevibacillus agri]
MKPAAFDYLRPSSVEEACQLLTDYGDEGKLIAGGQSLLPILNMRLSTPECLIDISGLQELKYIEIDGDWLRIGALTRQRDVERSALIRERVPLLAEAVPFIGHMQTRNRGTIGGSLVHADPTAEIPLSLLALNASAVIQSTDETREVDLNDFFITYLTTDIMPGELLREVKIPLQSMAKGYSFQEYSRKHGDFALVAAACVLDADEDGIITSVRLTLGGVDAVPVLAEDAADILIGEKLTAELLQEAARAASANVDPEADLHASREYRLQLARVYAAKAIETAYKRAVGKEGTT